MTFLETHIAPEDRVSIERNFDQSLEKYGHDYNALKKPLKTMADQHGSFVYQLFFQRLFSLRLSAQDAGILWDECLNFYHKLLQNKDFEVMDYRLVFSQYLINNKSLSDPVIMEKHQKGALLQSTYTDKLTGLYNHRYFKQFLLRELSRHKRSGLPLSLIMLDIDYFKKINDVYGHITGDFILKEIGRVLSISVRSSDMPSRYGGEEFALILPDTAGKGAVVLAERIQKRLSFLSFQGIAEKITLSMGIACYPGHASDVQELVQCADEAMFKAKSAGRNCIKVFERKGDQRKQNRKTFQTTGHYTHEGSTDTKPFITKNVSPKGLLIQTISPIKLGETIQLYMHINQQSDQIKCIARAVHIHHAYRADIFEIGMEILHIDGQDEHKLESILKN